MTNGGPVQKQGMSPWAWVAIGCGGLLVLCGLVFAVVGYFIYGKAKEVVSEVSEDPIAFTSRIIAEADPEIELVEADKDNRRVTFRNTETGEEGVHLRLRRRGGGAVQLHLRRRNGLDRFRPGGRGIWADDDHHR